MALDGLTGIASGVDTSGIVERLMELERGRRDRMDLSKARIQARQAALGTVQTKLLALRMATAGLRDVGTWADKQTVESSDPSKVAVQRLSGAGPGGYTVNVTALARAEQRSYAYAAPATATQLDIGGVQVDLAAGASLDDAVAAVNRATGSPVYATKSGERLVLSARTTGTDSAFTVSGPNLSDEVVRAGANAAYSIDGGETRHSQTNQVDDAVAGVRLTFKGVTASPASVTVSTAALDPEAVKAKVQAFVDAYNDLLRTTRGLLDERPVAGAASVEDAKKGALYGDTGLTALLSRLRTSTADKVLGNPSAMDELRELGVSTGAATGGRTGEDAKMGVLVLDGEALAEALEDPQGVRRMLGGLSGVEGFSQRLENLTKSYVGANGTLTGRIKETDTALVDLQRQMTDEDARLKAREDRLKAQFAAMESALAASQTQQLWLSGQLAKL